MRRNPLPVLELEKVRRQQDENFIKILNHIREGIYTKPDIDEINKRLKIGYEPSKIESGIFLRTTRYNVKHYNNSKLWRLPGKLYTFLPYIEGKFNQKLYPTDNPLKLKVGAKVMLLRNDNDGLKFVNGTQGVIKSIDDNGIKVLTNEGEPITVELSTWKLYKYEWDKQTKSIVPIVYASFTQYPLKLAWAVTIHKSQGMTFNKVTIDAHNSFAPGQVYVALSRCSSLEGITLTSRISKKDIMVDPKVVEYMKSVDKIDPNETEQESMQSIKIPKGDYVIGQYFETLSESHIKESKKFCMYGGKFFCFVVMTHKGFFLKLIEGGYYFLSELLCNYPLGNIWVKNKRGRLLDYDVCFTADGMKPMPFGHFIEGLFEKTLTYRNLETGDTFTLDLMSGKRK